MEVAERGEIYHRSIVALALAVVLVFCLARGTVHVLFYFSPYLQPSPPTATLDGSLMTGGHIQRTEGLFQNSLMGITD